MRLQNVTTADVKRFLAASGCSGRFAKGGKVDDYLVDPTEFRRRMVRRKNPLVPGMNDYVNQPIYDSMSLAANTAFPKTYLFQNAQGQGAAPKTLAQTNMVQVGVLPSPQRLEIHTISVWIANNTTLTDMINILTNVSLTLQVNTKPYWQGPVLFLPAGCGAVLNSAAQIGTAPAGAAPAFSTGNGISDTRAVFAMSAPLIIESGESFVVILNPETPFNTQANTTNPPGVGTTIYVKLDGVLYRGVS